MKKLCFKIISILVVLEVCLVTSVSCVFAAKDGSGGGNGAAAKLKLEDCSINDGMENVDTNLNIEMKFTKNVVDLTVQENNEQAISLKTKTGEDADYEIYFPEEFEKRQYIEINAELEQNTQYVLKVDKTLMSRNGTNLSKDYEVNFTTDNKTDENANEEQQENNTNEIKNDNKIVEEKTKSNIGYLYYFLLLAVVVILVLVKKRGNKNV